jgi:hypothetical protein
MPDDPELFSIVPVVGKAPSDAICTGPMSEVTTYIGQSIARIAEEERLAQAQRDAEETERHQQETRAHNAQMFVNGIAHLATRLDQFEARKKAHEEQLQREAQAAENARIEALLDALPDPDNPDVETALKDATHAPTGELHSVAPVDKEHLDPESEASGDTITGLTPPDLEATTPPEPGDFTPTAPAPSPYRTPASIGLN